MELSVFEKHDHLRGEIPIIFNKQSLYTPGRSAFLSGNWHPNVEILLFLEGEGRVYCNGEEYAVCPGSLIVVNPNELHSLLSQNGMAFNCLIIDASFLIDNGFRVDSVQFETLINCETVVNLYREIEKEVNNAMPYRTTAIRTRVLELMVYLARNYACPGNKQPAAESIKRAIGYIRSNFSRAITLERVAQEVHLDKCYLAREFKKATGMTVITYLNMIRCENARRMLATGKCSVKEVGLRCGYENSSYFAKTFKNIMGYLPSEVGKESVVHL